MTTENKAGIPEKIYAEPRPHLIIHGANLETMARYAYNEMRHDKCVPYYSESALAEAKATARKEAFEEAAKEVDAWRDLLETDHRDILAKGQYKDPQEAGREYRNKQNLLGSVAHGIRDKIKARASGASKGGE